MQTCPDTVIPKTLVLVPVFCMSYFYVTGAQNLARSMHRRYVLTLFTFSGHSVHAFMALRHQHHGKREQWSQDASRIAIKTEIIRKVGDGGAREWNTVHKIMPS